MVSPAEFTEYCQYISERIRATWIGVYTLEVIVFYIKKFEDETNLRCHFLVDRSSSMAYTSSAYTKADYGSTLATTLAYFLSMQGDAFGLATLMNHWLIIFRLATDQGTFVNSCLLWKALQKEDPQIL